MMTKYQMISAMAAGTAMRVSKNAQSWTEYLDTAARLYKYPFNEQLLIYAQRPEATACASLEVWNEKMNCWVNRGAKGIALIDTESERPRLKYVFDIADVHKAKRIGRDPYLWELKEEHKEAVLARLEQTYGGTDEKQPFEQRIIEIAESIASDYYEELLPEIAYVITLEIEGRMFDSEAFAEKIRDLGINGVSHIVFVIGGSLGLHNTIKERADLAVSFSKMTFPHQLMRVVLLEQVYRAYRIINGEPYHK